MVNGGRSNMCTKITLNGDASKSAWKSGAPVRFLGPCMVYMQQVERDELACYHCRHEVVEQTSIDIR